MIFDLVLFGGPLVLGICLAAHAIREGDSRFWMAAFSYFAYCAFYLAGGREVILYLACMFFGGRALLF